MERTEPQDKKRDLLLIFTRNPQLGKCKTRLAETIGDQAALDIYRFLLEHTAAITRNLPVSKTVYYSDEIWENDLWERPTFAKALQQGHDLGERMMDAFDKGFKAGYQRIVVIGSDMYDLRAEDLERAFNELEASDYVIGPARDGGYYLLGMKALNKKLFRNKNWGTGSVLKDSLKDLKEHQLVLLSPKNDVDIYEDIKDQAVFEPFIKHLKNDERTTG